MLTTALFLSLLLAQPGTPAPTATLPAPTATADAPRDIGDLLAPILKKHKVPGMAAAVVLDGKIVAIGATGLRELGKPDAVTVGDLWHLGSCTKAMTATLAAVMVEKGEITWETTLGETFPEIAMKDAWKPVTLRQLTTNRSGAPGGLDKDGLWGKLWSFKGTPTEARLALLTGVVANEPDAAPGSKFIYSNGAFAMAGAMLERKSGKGWEELITERLFKPLGITTAGFGAPGDAKTITQPRGHRGGKAMPPGPAHTGADNPVAIGPAGIAHMSIADWARFVMAHADGERPVDQGSTLLLKPDAFKFLHEPYPATDAADKERYAGGWMVSTRPWAKGAQDRDTGRVLTHGGSNTLWHCVTWVAPERRFAVVVACNQGDGEATKANDAAAWAMIQEFLVKK
jgi:CubicO group peptidase (beta-lactamase class C family)